MTTSESYNTYAALMPSAAYTSGGVIAGCQGFQRWMNVGLPTLGRSVTVVLDTDRARLTLAAGERIVRL